MATNDLTGAPEKKIDTYKCKWRVCNEKHEIDLKHFNEIDTDFHILYGRDLDWTKPFTHEDVYGVNEPTHLSEREGTNTNINYPTQQHHVIPAATFDDELQDLKTNLLLVGWDINFEVFNGIVLPWFPVDIFFHDLQCHPGLPDSCHNAYSKDIIKKLADVEVESLELCHEEEHEDLVLIMYEFVKEIRNDIINWNIIIYPTVSSNAARIASFERAGIFIPPPIPKNRKFPF